MLALAIATPILRVTNRAPWRTILFATASVVALSVSPPASAQCVQVPGSATCPVDAGNYAGGISLNDPGDFTVIVDDGVTVTPDAAGDAVFVNGAVSATVNTDIITITTVEAASNGMVVESGVGGSNVTLGGGAITATGANSAGLVVESTGPVTIDSGANIFGGGSGGVVIAPGNDSATLTNSGIIGSSNDLAISGLSNGELTVVNSGTITGFVQLDGTAADAESAGVTFNNSGTLALSNFTDTVDDGDEPDLEAVAIANFGDDGVFNNEAGGTVTLGDASSSTTQVNTGQLFPEIGENASFNITVVGVEQGQLTGLTEFNNAGAIDLQDGVAGDVLVISNGVGGAPGTTVFTSEGGTLLLDTFINQGGAIDSLSDVLILDATELGTAPTRVFIQNAGGPGGPTIEDGILVIEVLDPDQSNPNAFEIAAPGIVGPFQYNLFHGSVDDDPLDGNWYLRQDGLAPTTDAYRSYPSSVMRSARLAVGTLQQRVGNRWWHVPEQRTQRTVTDPAPPPQPSVRDFVVFFDWDRDEIRPDAAAVINEAAEYAKSGNAARILVVGHTDTSGSAEYNMGLSERRAANVSRALQGEGVNAQVIGMEWLGETQPAVDTGDGVREQANRRATIQVAVPGTPDPSAAGRTRVVEDVIPASTLIQGSGVWGRIVGLDGEYDRDDDLGEIDETAFMAQVGVDFAFGESDTSKFIGSVAVHYIDSETGVSTEAFGDVADIDSEGWGVSGGVTWYNESGAYVDGVLSGTWFESDIGGDVLGELASGNEGFAWAASVEGGMRYEASPNYYWVPQGQLIYTHVDIDEFTDPFGAVVDHDDPDSLVGRVGVAFEYLNSKPNDAGDMTHVQGYGIVNLLYEFLGAPGASVSGIDLDEDIDDFWGELGAGFTYGFNAQWAVYGEASYRTALENFGDSQAIQGSLGVRYNW